MSQLPMLTLTHLALCTLLWNSIIESEWSGRKLFGFHKHISLRTDEKLSLILTDFPYYFNFYQSLRHTYLKQFEHFVFHEAHMLHVGNARYEIHNNVFLLMSRRPASSTIALTSIVFVYF